MIRRKRENIILKKAKKIGDAITSMRLFTAIQDKLATCS